VSHVQFSRIINGRAEVTPDLTIRLFKWIPAPTAILDEAVATKRCPIKLHKPVFISAVALPLTLTTTPG